VIIVLAWTVEDRVWDGEPYARDLGAAPGWKTVQRPLACVWLNKGTEADMAKAKAHAAQEGAQVLTFPEGTEDPLGLAREVIFLTR
jgi:hypothetical protein